MGDELLLNDRVEQGLKAIEHRGPDAFAVQRFDSVVLGHVRLSIIDTSEASNQPFNYGDVTLVFNGEIWNYKELRQRLPIRFNTTGDTEVMAAALHYWGPDALRHIEGMFAVAWTTDGYTLNVARDRFGEVPLHVAVDSGMVASEVKGLLAAGCDPKDVQWVEPGQRLLLSPGAPTIAYQWYSPNVDFVAGQKTTGEEARKWIRRGIEAGSQERTISDVPVCTLLSGGIDSAAVALHAKELIPNLVAYTAVMDPKSADLRSAREVAEFLEMPLIEVPIVSPGLDDIRRVISSIEMPHKAQVEIGWPCLNLAERMRSDGFKVTMSGEGSDELWASYGFSYRGVNEKGWFPYRRELFVGQHRKNFARCNKIFMARGVECRLPFLNTGLVEFALGLPRDVVQRGSKLKAVMQDAYVGYLPDRITKRAKVAFQDGLGLKKAIAEQYSDPKRIYRTEFGRVFDGVRV